MASSQDMDGPDPDRERAIGRRGLLALLAAIVVVGAGAAVLFSHTGGSTPLPSDVKSTTQASFEGAVATPARPAPPLRLRNYDGRLVDLRDLRGKATLVTFLYTHCPDVCPLIEGNLDNTRQQLGPLASKVRMIAVSVDPRGDTASSVRTFLRAHDMLGRMDYLLGSKAALGRVWKAWNVGSDRDTSNPELVAHSALVYGITASGRVKTLYPADFKPAQIVHDVPRLLAL